MLTQPTSEQQYKIQLVRGIAIIAVVLIHSLPVAMIQVFVRPFINFAVPCFLFLSGMLSNADRWHPWKRIKKILIPYVLWTLLYTFLKQYRTLSALPLAYLKSLLKFNSAAIMYYVYVYCELTLLIPLLDRLAKSRYRLLGLLITPLEILFMRLLSFVGLYRLPHILVLIRSVSCVGFVSFFYLGYLIGNGYLKNTIPIRRLALLILLAILLQMAEGYGYYQISAKDAGTAMKLSAALTSCLCCLLLSRFINDPAPAQNRLFKLLGDNSFGIFFAHIFILRLIKHIPGYKTYLLFPINGVLVLAITLALVLLGKRILGRYGKYLAL